MYRMACQLTFVSRLLQLNDTFCLLLSEWVAFTIVLVDIYIFSSVLFVGGTVATKVACTKTFQMGCLDVNVL